VRLAQTGHLLTPFVDDAEGRSHDARYANRTVIEIKRKKRRADHCQGLRLFKALWLSTPRARSGKGKSCL
jgi:hypothetical protein